MKRFFTLAAITVAISFASCGGKNGANVAEEDSLMIDTVATLDQAQTLENVAASLTEKLQKGDAASIQAIIAEVEEQVRLLVEAGDSETAAQYVEKVQNFIAENQEKLEQITQSGTTTMNDILNTVKALPAAAGEKVQVVADSVVNDAKAQVEKKADEAIENVKAQATEKVNAAINDATNDAKKKLGL